METWKDIPGYEGRYQVSDEGRVRNAAGHVLAAQITNSGYSAVHLYQGGRQRRVHLIHRLVALAFHPSLEGSTEVNHRNANKQDNAAHNLEWVTRSQNIRHAHATGLMAPRRYPVVGRSKKDGHVVRFDSQIAAEIALCGKASSAVNHCIAGKKRSAYGYVWSRA